MTVGLVEIHSHIVESENLIVQYIESNDCKVSESDVVRFMKSDKVEHHLTLSKVTVHKAIDRLIVAKRIRICNEPERRGQTHYLGINRKNNFDQIIKFVSDIDNDITILDRDYNPIRKTKDVAESIKMYDGIWTKSVDSYTKFLRISLSRIKNEINTDTEKRICYERVVNTMDRLTVIDSKVEKLIRLYKQDRSRKKKSKIK